MHAEATPPKVSDMSKLNDSDAPDRFDSLKRRINNMADRKLRLLIAEKEYLIALDARQIVSGLLPCEAEISTMPEFEQRLGEDSWDLVLIDVAGDLDNNRHHANMILAAGAGLVFLTGHRDLAHGVPGLGEWPVVTKPFTSATLLDAVSRGLSLVGKVGCNAF
jgi:hypothetical protein